MLSGAITWLKTQANNIWFVILGSMFAGEYLKPGRMISDLLDKVRRGI